MFLPLSIPTKKQDVNISFWRNEQLDGIIRKLKYEAPEGDSHDRSRNLQFKEFSSKELRPVTFSVQTFVHTGNGLL